MATLDRKNVRYNILIMIIYIIAIVMIIRLFNIQIVHGAEYAEKSNSRLTRENTIKAARGNILDCNGVIIAGNKTEYTLELYKSKIKMKDLNETLLNTINILEKNGDKYRDEFPISLNPIKFTFSNDEREKKWIENNNIKNAETAEQVLKYYIKKYELENYSIEDARKIIAIRYGVEVEGYSSMSAYVISDGISEKSVAMFEEQNASFPGISIKYSPTRSYKYGALASHILGYVGRINEDEYKNNEGYTINDYIGKMGIEYVLEKYLKGEDGLKQTDMSIDGTTTAEYITKEAVQGNDVVLTIDAKLQDTAEKALSNNIYKINSGGFGKVYNVKTGCAIVIEVNTGNILAMASYPNFEPELFVQGISNKKWAEYTREDASALINRSMQSAYAPGSIFKMVGAVAGLETGKLTETELINCAGIYHAGGGYDPRCWYYTSYGVGHGNLNVSGAIKNSCNCYFYEVGSRIGIETLEKYAEYFGLGQKTNIELPGEVSGTLAGKKLYDSLGQTWYYGQTLSAVIGQAENNFTPLQIAKYIAMLANGGHAIDVSIIQKIVKPDGLEIDNKKIEQEINKKLGLGEINTKDLNIKPETINAVLEGMKSVAIEAGGTAYQTFKDFPIEIGGKTGSAEAGKKVNAWFVGFAPYEKPEIAVVVFEENGGHGYYAAEVTKNILEEYFGINKEVQDSKAALPYTEQIN